VYGTVVSLGNHFLSVTGSGTLALGYRRYDRPATAIAGLLDLFYNHGLIFISFRIIALKLL